LNEEAMGLGEAADLDLSDASELVAS